MIVAKTEAGIRVLKDRSIPLTPRQRSAFILIDGKRTLDQILTSSAAMGVSREDVEQLFQLGLITDTSPAETQAEQDARVLNSAAINVHNARSPTQRYQDAYPIATQLTAALGLRGVLLNLAVEGAGNYDQLLALAPRIRDAVGAEKYATLDRALRDL